LWFSGHSSSPLIPSIFSVVCWSSPRPYLRYLCFFVIFHHHLIPATWSLRLILSREFLAALFSFLDDFHVSSVNGATL
jgi:hypothetical protein